MPHFEEILDDEKEDKGVELDTDLDADDLKRIAEALQGAGRRRNWASRSRRMCRSSSGAPSARCSAPGTARAPTPIASCNNIPEDWGTAVTVQAMVFGNRGETSATGVAFTRDPATGEKLLYGEFLINAQGEDVVAGIRTPQPISKVVRERQGGKKPSMEEAMPKAFAELKAIGERLEKHYRDMQDVEFTVQEGKLFMLQTRSGKRTAEAALKAAVDMVGEGLIDKNDRGHPRRSAGAGPVAASHARSRRAQGRDRHGPGRLAGRRHRRSRLHRRGSREARRRQARRHPGAHRNQPGRHSRHACGAGAFSPRAAA